MANAFAPFGEVVLTCYPANRYPEPWSGIGNYPNPRPLGLAMGAGLQRSTVLAPDMGKIGLNDVRYAVYYDVNTPILWVRHAAPPLQPGRLTGLISDISNG